MHPKLVACNMGEDMMGKMRSITNGCCKGIPPWEVPNKALIRYLSALDCVFKDPERWLSVIAKHKV